MPTKSDGIETLGLSARVNNALRAKGVTEVGQLTQVTPKEILVMKNLGNRSLQEIEDALRKCGLTLAKDGEAQAQAFKQELELKAAVKSLRDENKRLSEQLRQLREENAELKKRHRSQPVAGGRKPRGKPRG